MIIGNADEEDSNQSRNIIIGQQRSISVMRMKKTAARATQVYQTNTIPSLSLVTYQEWYCNTRISYPIERVKVRAKVNELFSSMCRNAII